MQLNGGGIAAVSAQVPSSLAAISCKAPATCNQPLEVAELALYFAKAHGQRLAALSSEYEAQTAELSRALRRISSGMKFTSGAGDNVIEMSPRSDAKSDALAIRPNAEGVRLPIGVGARFERKPSGEANGSRAPHVCRGKQDLRHSARSPTSSPRKKACETVPEEMQAVAALPRRQTSRDSRNSDGQWSDSRWDDAVGDRWIPDAPEGASNDGNGSHSGSMMQTVTSHEVQSDASNMAPLELRPLWNVEGQEARLERSRVLNTALYRSPTRFSGLGDTLRGRRRWKVLARASSDDEVVTGEHRESKGCLKNLAVRPTSFKRLFWDLLSLVVIAYDLLTFPLRTFGFGTDEAAAVDYTGVATTVFWSLDLVFSFFQGFHDDGAIEMRLSRIAKRYAKTWLAPDFAVVAVDWFLLVTFEGMKGFIEFARLGRTIRTVRVMRMFRLMRIMKMAYLLEELSDLTLTDRMHDLFSVVKFICGIVFVNHFVACAWHAIGNMGVPGNRWFDLLVDDFDVNPGMSYTYVAAFHWSLAQFTPAPNNFHPQNYHERTFAVIVLLFGLVLFSFFLGSITSALTHMRTSHAEKSKQDVALRRYFTENRISLDLGNRIHAFIRSQWSLKRPPMRMDDVYYLRLLPPTLMAQLRCEVHEPVLITHPLFDCIGMAHSTTMIEICDRAMSEKSYSTGAEIFHYGQDSKWVYWPIRGSSFYRPREGKETHFEGDTDRIEVSCRNVLCELSIWVNWKHRGKWIADRGCFAMSLADDEFRKIVSTHTGTLHHCRKYAQMLVWHCNELGEIDDRGIPYDDLQKLAMGSFRKRESEASVQSADPTSDLTTDPTTPNSAV